MGNLIVRTGMRAGEYQRSIREKDHERLEIYLPPCAVSGDRKGLGMNHLWMFLDSWWGGWLSGVGVGLFLSEWARGKR